jgi:hypothetical protein
MYHKGMHRQSHSSNHVARKGAKGWCGHHPLWVNANDVLMEDFDIQGMWVHDLSVDSLGTNNVWSNGKGDNLNMVSALGSA